MNAVCGSTVIPDRLLGSWLSDLSGAELKVMLYLTLQSGGHLIPDLAVRPSQIAAATNLSKKEVRIALRLLHASHAFAHCFALPTTALTGSFSKPRPKQSA
jgi:hypothetical protein